MVRGRNARCRLANRSINRLPMPPGAATSFEGIAIGTRQMSIDTEVLSSKPVDLLGDMYAAEYTSQSPASMRDGSRITCGRGETLGGLAGIMLRTSAMGSRPTGVVRDRTAQRGPMV